MSILPARALFTPQGAKPGGLFLSLVFAALLALCGCGPTGEAPPAPTTSAGAALTVSSPAFSAGGQIPSLFTCDGADHSPPLAWTQPPAAAKSLALVVDDPDAPGGTFVHWVLYSIPSGVTSLEEGAGSGGALPSGSKQGTNGFGSSGYKGPCPPSGTHHYRFKLYALDTQPSLAPGAERAELEKAMSGHIVAQGELVGVYTRK